MGIGAVSLRNSGKAVAFVYVSDRERALSFYRDKLDLELRSSDQYGDYLELPGALLRIMVMPELKPHEHPVLGFEVDDIVSVARALRERGVVLDIFEGWGQDELGIWSSEDGSSKLAFFKDGDGNALMLSQG